MKQQPFIGQWRLKSWEITDHQGQVKTPLGEHGQGYLFYLPNGYMSVHLMNPQFLDFKETPFAEQAKLPSQSLEQFFSCYFSYTGKYTIDEHSVYHQVEMCSIPSLINMSLKRDYQLANNKLTLTNKTEWDNAFNDSQLVWHKESD